MKGKKLGLLGHSLGGLATIDVYQRLKADVDFLVQRATPIEKYGADFIYQIVQDYYDRALTAKKTKATTGLWESICSIVAKNSDKGQIELYKILSKELKKKGYKRREFGWKIAYPNNTEIIKKNYEGAYQHIGIPMLYIIGPNDRHVNPKRSTEILKGFHNDHIKTLVMKGLNHYLNDIAPLKLSDIYRINKKAHDTIIGFVQSVD